MNDFQRHKFLANAPICESLGKSSTFYWLSLKVSTVSNEYTQTSNEQKYLKICSLEMLRGVKTDVKYYFAHTERSNVNTIYTWNPWQTSNSNFKPFLLSDCNSTVAMLRLYCISRFALSFQVNRLKLQLNFTDLWPWIRTTENLSVAIDLHAIPFHAQECQIFHFRCSHFLSLCNMNFSYKRKVNWSKKRRKWKLTSSSELLQCIPYPAMTSFNRTYAMKTRKL